MNLSGLSRHSKFGWLRLGLKPSPFKTRHEPEFFRNLFVISNLLVSGADSCQLEHTPERVCEKEAEGAGHHQRAVFCFQQVGTDTSNEDEEEWNGDQLKS